MSSYKWKTTFKRIDLRQVGTSGETSSKESPKKDPKRHTQQNRARYTSVSHDVEVSKLWRSHPKSNKDCVQSRRSAKIKNRRSPKRHQATRHLSPVHKTTPQGQRKPEIHQYVSCRNKTDRDKARCANEKQENYSRHQLPRYKQKKRSIPSRCHHRTTQLSPTPHNELFISSQTYKHSFTIIIIKC